ncbi:MAG TPA: Flp family type IVb pilin [Caulobacter sp.]|nr:Flp family type IVb pilin [Caulobacter sp.]
MGKARQTRGLPDAAGRRAAGRLAARPHLSLRVFWRDERGATAIEYGMIAALVFLVVVTSMTAFGNKTTAIIGDVSAAVDGAIGGGG